jgi:chromosome partitioning protein
MHAFAWVMHDVMTAADAVPLETYKGQFDITVTCKVDQTTVRKHILGLAREHDVVLVDLQGSANTTMVYAFGVSDLVIVPAQASNFDIQGAAKTITTLREAAEMANRTIHERIMLTRTNPSLRPRSEGTTRTAFEKAGMTVMTTTFADRIAFKDQTFTGAAPTVADPNSNAAANIRALYGEIQGILVEGQVAAAE